MTARFALALVVLLLAAQGFGQPWNSSDSDDWATSAELSARQLIENPQSEDAWVVLVRARIHLGDLKRAEQALKDWRAKVSSPPAMSDRLEGELALKKSEAPRAARALRRYVQRAPKDPEGWELLASALGAGKDWANGLDAMGRALAIRSDAAGFVQRARLRIRSHDWAGAEADVRQANELDARNTGVQMLLPTFEESATWRPTVTELDQKLKKQPRDYQALLDRAEWLRWARFTDAARDDIEAALEINPQSLRVRFWSGMAAQEQRAAEEKEGKAEEGKPDRKEKAGAQEVMPMASKLIDPTFERGLKAMDGESDPERRALFLLKYHQTLMALREVEGTDGSPAKAQALLDLGRLPQGGDAARRATAQHPGSAVAWLALARWELESGNYGEALDAVKRSAKAHKTPEAEELRKLAQQRLGKR